MTSISSFTTRGAQAKGKTLKPIMLSILCCVTACAPGSQPVEIKPGQARYDDNCNYLDAPQPVAKIHLAGADKYFNKDIPKTIHQIWFGAKKQGSALKTSAWERFAQEKDYNYRLWSEQDLAQIKTFVSAENFANLTYFLGQGDFWAASDILRLELLRQYGGIYADVDIAPPTRDGQFLDFQDLMPMKNIVFVTETNGRTIGNSSLFVCNNFMASSPQHPLMTHLADHVAANIDSWRSQCVLKDVKCHDNAVYQTGPFYVSLSLTGALTILPISYTHALNMTDEDK